VISAVERRATTIERLAAERFDLVVIGGGITGAGIARDAAIRGLRTALVEQRDFASGTSSRSSRLVHGGVRYLEHGHLHLVFESSRERRILLDMAPHLVHPLAFTWPVYRGARISRPMLIAGLALYDTLALFRNVGQHERLNRREVLDREPALRADHLLGGAMYFDAATDDARLTLANVVAAVEAGAAVANYCRVTGLVGAGRQATGVTVVDALTNRTFEVRARVLVNATGPWTDALQRQEQPAARPAILGSKGAHIAVPRARVGNRQAVTMLHPDDGRVMFTLPAGERTIVGTTETAAPAETRATREDVAYLLAAANRYFPGAELGERDVIAAWAGIRPLAAGLAGEDPSSASREHAITTGARGVVSVTGGKLTTYRAVAEEVVDHVVDAVGRPLVQRCVTAHLPLPGGEKPASELMAGAAAVPMPAAARERLLAVYGTRWPLVWEIALNEPALGEPLGAGGPEIGAEFVYAVEREMALTLGDLLIRRTHVAFESRDHGVSLAPLVAGRVGARLGWDAARQDAEVRAYEREVEGEFAIETSG
jgi:glycerol-3-phosphate dehydrogenase